MAEKVTKKQLKPFSHKVIMSVLAFVLAGGGYGGYEVYKTYGTYGARFDERPHLVEEVVDGDTLIIEEGIRVRLLGVDAPENGECFSEESKKNLEKLVLGREIVLEKDQTAKDNYSRLLRYAFLYRENPESDNVFLNKKLVRDGFAFSDYVKPNRRYLSQLQAAQREAEKENVGIWGQCDTAKNEAEAPREQASDPWSNECVIKGNISKNYTKDYFLPGCPNYKRVKVDPRKGEQWFCTEQSAQEAGFQKSNACENIWQTKSSPTP